MADSQVGLKTCSGGSVLVRQEQASGVMAASVEDEHGGAYDVR